jgi:hypothetical protein
VVDRSDKGVSQQEPHMYVGHASRLPPCMPRHPKTLRETLREDYRTSKYILILIHTTPASRLVTLIASYAYIFHLTRLILHHIPPRAKEITLLPNIRIRLWRNRVVRDRKHLQTIIVTRPGSSVARPKGSIADPVGIWIVCDGEADPVTAEDLAEGLVVGGEGCGVGGEEDLGCGMQFGAGSHCELRMLEVT